MKNAFTSKALLRLCVAVLSVFMWQIAGAQTYSGAGNPQPIPMVGTGGFPCVGGPTTSAANVPLTGTVGADYLIESVEISLTHTFDSDLEIDLISPDGTIWDLSSDNGGAGDNFIMTVFEDGAPSITTGAAPFTGTFEAEQGPMNGGFAGDNVNGNWTLSICDDAGGDSGQLTQFDITFLEISCDLTCPADVEVDNDFLECGAFVNIPLPTATGLSCGTIALGTETYGPVVADLDFVGGDLVATPFNFPGVPVSSPADVTISGNWNTDNGFATETPTFTAEGILLGNLPAGTTGDCAANGFSFTMSAADYNTVAANGSIDFVVGADPDVDLFCAVNNITVEIEVASSVGPYVNDYNGTENASDFYPVGTTTVCYTTNLTVGGTVTCCFDVTVNDVDGPVFTNCPTDQTINLDPGLCSTIFTYNPVVEENCPAMAASFNLGGFPGTQGINCNAGNAMLETSTYRTWTVPAGGDVLIESIDTDVAIDGGGNSYEARAYVNVGGPFPAGTLTEISATAGTLISDGTLGTINIPLVPSGVASAGDEVVIELYIPDGGFAHFWGYGAGATSPTYLQSVACGAPTPTDVTAFAIFNGLALQINAAPATSAEPVQTAGPDASNGAELPIGDTYFEYEATDAAGNTEVCAFTVTVAEYANPISTLACNDNVQVSLDETGCATIGADLILEGGPYGCYDDYIVDIVPIPGYPNDQACCTELGGPWTVMVEDPDTGNKCWGSIIIEDKLDPIITCFDFSILCTQDADDVVGNATTINYDVDSGLAGTWPSVGSEDVEFDVDLGGAIGTPTVTDIEVSLDVTHTWVGDLSVTVLDPAGNAHILFAAQCGNTDNVDATFSDDGAALACGGTPVISGDNLPQSGTFGGSALVGNDPNGTWIVRISDAVAGDGGTINNVNLNLTIDAVVLPPTVEDNCTVVSFTYTDVFEGDDCSGDAGTITRTYTAVDQSGNSSTCTSTITVERPSLDDVQVPPSLDDIEAPSLDCSGNPWDLNGDGYPQPNESGQPTIGGINFENGDICGITSYYDDTVLPICNESFKVRREWVITDWCTGEEIVYVQFVKVIDTTGPDVVCPAGPVTINVYQGDLPGGPHDICTGTVVIPPVEVLGDDCSGLAPADYMTELWTLGAGIKLQEISGNGGAFFGVELEADNPPSNNAQYTIRHVIYDECGNLTECIYDIVVVDKVPPTPICDEITEISITNNGGSGEGCSYLPAEVLDDGSYDNCGDVYFYAAKMNPFLPPPYFYQYYPTLQFCCDEIGENMVILLVLDFDPSAFALPDGSIFLLPGQAAFEGSFNTCMVTVEVTDKIPPITIFCPGPETITCEEYVNDYAASVNNGNYDFLDAFGEAEFYDNCATNTEYDVTVNINSCQEGTIVRNWTTSDDNPQNATASCTQTIFVEHVSDWVVEFPADIVAECTDGQLPDFGEPNVTFDECELIGLSYEDQYFYVVPDACYKIVRTWTAINWCIYEDWGYDAYSEEDHFEAAYFADWDGDGDSDNRTFRDGWNDDGAPGTPDGYIVYEQVIKVNDSEAPEFVIPEIDGCIVDTDCDTDITLPYPDILDQCSATFEVDLSGDFGDFTDIAGDITIDDVVPGEYTVYYVVTDNCGNSSYDEVTIVVEDCKLPTPYCLNGIVVEIMQTGMIDVWASDLNLGSFDNCPGALKFSFSPDVDDIGVTYTCDDLGQQPVEIWVTDAAGNQDFCETFIVVQDNMGHCGGAPIAVAGIIATEEDETVEDVTVDVNGGLFSEITGADGYYTFALDAGNDYTVTPMNDLDPSNGVTTYDLVLISMHILGVQPLDSPYKMIAADANNSQSVSTLDMVLIRKLILQVENNFPNNTSWRFVDADYDFPVATNPWFEAFPEVLNYNNIAAADLAADFVGVKIGDVNASAAANGLAGVDNRTMVGDLVLNAAAQSVKAGELYTVTFTAQEVEVLGYQFTLNFDQTALELVEIVAGTMTAENFGTSMLSEGAITASWNVADAQVLNGDVFSLVFKASADAELAELLSIGSRYTAAEAYNANGDLLNVSLNIDGASATAGFELYQNVPNPFKGQTVIGFNLPEASTATLTITDVSGKVLRVVQSDYAKGYNEVNVANLSATGVLYYQLETANDTATRKMILVK